MKAEVKCYAPGDRCHGCAHYRGEAPICEFAPKGQELLDRLQTLGDNLPAPYNADTALAAKATLERYLALADELDADRQFIEDTLVDTGGAVWRRDVAKRLREIAEGREET